MTRRALALLERSRAARRAEALATRQENASVPRKLTAELLGALWLVLDEALAPAAGRTPR